MAALQVLKGHRNRTGSTVLKRLKKKLVFKCQRGLWRPSGSGLWTLIRPQLAQFEGLEVGK